MLLKGMFLKIKLPKQHHKPKQFIATSVRLMYCILLSIVMIAKSVSKTTTTTAYFLVNALEEET